jgi:uncharacterized cupredoxin-like copper-binding protein
VRFRRERIMCSDVLPLLTPEPWSASTRDRSRERPLRPLAVLVVASAGAVLASCGSDGVIPDATDTIGRGDTVAVVGTDSLTFDPSVFTMPAGQKVTLELTAGSVEHDFVVEGAASYGTAGAGHEADNSADLHVAHADEGDTVTTTFKIDRARAYIVYCSVVGHREAGMLGSLEVTETPA